MTDAQSGILPEANSHALFVGADIERSGAIAHIRKVCGQIPRLTAELAATDPAAGLVSVLGIGAGAWEPLMGSARPAGLAPFQVRAQGLHQAPSTPTDLFFHIRSERRDLNFELMQRLSVAFGSALQIREETAGFNYLGGRDLTGFVDGTENPEGEDRAAAALVGQEDPSFAGGSYMLVQRYVHDLTRWRRLDVADQEMVIGRTKADDVELSDETKPDTAHIARVVIEEDGEELEILRHSLPYGDQHEAGLVFMAYCRTPRIFDLMLDRMFLTDAEGHYDHLMDFTRAVSGAYYFAPSLESLRSLGK